MQQSKIQKKKKQTNSHLIFCWLRIKHGGGGELYSDNWYSLSDTRNKTQVVPIGVWQTCDPLVTSPGALPLSYKRLVGANIRFTH